MLSGFAAAAKTTVSKLCSHAVGEAATALLPGSDLSNGETAGGGGRKRVYLIQEKRKRKKHVDNKMMPTHLNTSLRRGCQTQRAPVVHRMESSSETVSRAQSMTSTSSADGGTIGNSTAAHLVWLSLLRRR